MILKKQKVRAGALLLTPISAGIQNTYAVPGVLKKTSRVRAFQPTAIIGFIGSALMLVSAQAFAVDSDGDGVDDLADNCTQVANPDQRDTDEDGYGNFCDADFNEDLATDLTDFSTFRTAFGTTSPDEDLDGSGTVDLSDFSLFRTMFGSAPGPSCVDTANGCAAPLDGGTLDPLSIPKYVTPLVIPPVMDNSGTADQYDIAVREFQQQILPGGIWNTINGRTDAFPATTIWSYGPATDALPDSTALGGAPGIAPAPNSQFNYPAYTMENLKDVGIAVNWINDLTSNAWALDPNNKGDALPHLFAVDQSLHWANPVADCLGGEVRTDCMGTTADPYTGPVPIVTHVHGSHVDASADGYTEGWWLPNADNITCIDRDPVTGEPVIAPNGYDAGTNTWEVVCEGTIANQLTDRSGTVNENTNVTPGVGNYVYQNDQPSATIWYHDHSLGMTRLNVMAGPAGFWLIRDATGVSGETGLVAGAVLPAPAPVRGEDLATTNLPASLNGERNKYREIPIVIQGRSFNTDGSLFYPDNRAFFEGLNVEGTVLAGTEQFPGEPELRINMDPRTSDIAPIWNPEAFFNSMVVNGVTWPKLEVAPAQYRFRLLNGTNARFLNLALKITDADGNPVTATRTFYVDGLGGLVESTIGNVDELDFYQIGAEQSLKPTVTAVRTAFATDLSGATVAANGLVVNPTPQSSTDQALLMGVAERADVIVDFRGLPDGTIITMTNTAADSPFGGFPDTRADPATTGQVMRFVVNSAHLGLSPTDELRDANTFVVTNPATAASSVNDLAVDPAALDNFDVVVTNLVERQLALIEEESELICVDVDLDGNLVQQAGIPVAGVCPVGEAFAPKAAVTGTVDVNNGAQVTLWSDPITTQVNKDGTGLERAEQWNLWNFTVDGHPIHVHLVKFKVLGRYAIGGVLGDGSSTVTASADGREAWEDGWKDTVITYPGEVTSIAADFDINGLYVWHCHIVEHEDNEMMVPMCVGVPGVDCPAQLF